ncbi:adenine phosphoribosyltransferase [Calycomorphotria hydatis]|uniref:Adenine phosphoribosyltransferase n=1 Tax=Calycomorphotria hydatis TaxID=2528027 RepID=A0A517TD46_9PLAN|nr:adenine phosphoribosyltransferase [Calycomorphotria hydatis]QDT66301.1 Adenine phosphoribosyltransferase [Calycomorphotria hydatis]
MSTATTNGQIDLKDYIHDVPDFPKPGILFKDITPLLAAPEAFGKAVDQFAAHFAEHDVTAIVAAEARGFIFAALLALKMNARFVPVRKPGKLPRETHSYSYELEYGVDTLEIHKDAITPSDRVLLIDDLLATGGTIRACTAMTENMGAKVVGLGFVVELDFLHGRDKLEGYDICSLLHY